MMSPAKILVIFSPSLTIRPPSSSIFNASPFTFPCCVSTSILFPIVDDLSVHLEIIFLVLKIITKIT